MARVISSPACTKIELGTQSSSTSSSGGIRRREKARFRNATVRQCKVLIPLLIILGSLFYVTFTHLHKASPRPDHLHPPFNSTITFPGPAASLPAGTNSSTTGTSAPVPPPPASSASPSPAAAPAPPPSPANPNSSSPAQSNETGVIAPAPDPQQSPTSTPSAANVSSSSTTATSSSADQLLTVPAPDAAASTPPTAPAPALPSLAAQRRLLYSQQNSSLVHSSASHIGPAPARDVVVVAKDGSGDFLNITAALQNTPQDCQGRRCVIYIKAGVYEEVLFVKASQKNLSLVGDGMGLTVITGNRSVGSGLFNTFTSAIVHVAGDGFFARDITFRNTAGPPGMQAVAMLAKADMVVFHRCSFEGYQDTLWAFAGRQFYSDCTISGTVDFIFGNAAAVFQNCKLLARLPMRGQKNAYTAQGRARADEQTGFVFQNCTLTGEEALLNNTAFPVYTYLGRPWQEFSRVVFLHCYMDALVHPHGWLAWNTSNPFTTTLFYAEFENSGPGSSTDMRVPWKGVHTNMTLAKAAHFAVIDFLAGQTWLPSFHIHFQATLVQVSPTPATSTYTNYNSTKPPRRLKYDSTKPASRHLVVL